MHLGFGAPACERSRYLRFVRRLCRKRFEHPDRLVELTRAVQDLSEKIASDGEVGCELEHDGQLLARRLVLAAQVGGLRRSEMDQRLGRVFRNELPERRFRFLAAARLERRKCTLGELDDLVVSGARTIERALTRAA